MTVEIKINGELKRKMRFENRGRSSDTDKTTYEIWVEQSESLEKKPSKFGPKKVLHIRDQGMMQLIANGFSALGWKPKPWSVPK